MDNSAPAGAPDSPPDAPYIVTHQPADESAGPLLSVARGYGRITQLLGTKGEGSRSRSSSAASAEGTAVREQRQEGAQESSDQGHSRPVSRTSMRQNSRATSLAQLAADPRYKRYSVQIERCLATFSEVTEWADLIAFLSRLLKALQSTSPSYSELPFKHIIAKRLAQGLNPALPNGVHQRSLDVYREVFKMIGSESLQRDMQIWSSGLFPFFQFASTSIRPALLEIYETYYLPLGNELRPVGKALTMAVLPGIEEETGDFFDRVINLLDRLRNCLGTQFMYQCFFLILITSPTSRLAAVNYLLRRLPQSINDASSGDGHRPTDVIGLDGGLYLRGLASALEDDNVLVQRGVLDLLVSALPISTLKLSSDFEEADKELLMRSACSIVLRRDLSISRRLYTWLLGSLETGQEEQFRTYGLDLVRGCLLSDMKRLGTSDQVDSSSFRPFRIFSSLLDKSEIGHPLSKVLVIPALLSLEAAVLGSRDKSIGEMCEGTARNIVESVEPMVLWSELYTSIQRETKEGVSSVTRLAIWLLELSRPQEEEVISLHTPLMLSMVMFVLERKFSKSANYLRRHSELFLHLIGLATRLCAIIPSAPTIGEPEGVAEPTETAADLAGSLYSDNNDNVPLDALTAAEYSAAYANVLANGLELFINVAPEDDLFIPVISLLDVVIGVGIGSDSPASWNEGAWWSRMAVLLSQSQSLNIVRRVAGQIIGMSRAPRLRRQWARIDRNAFAVTFKSLFRFLSIDRISHHREAGRLVWEIHSRAPKGTLRDQVAAAVATSDKAHRKEQLDAVANLWRFAGPGDDTSDAMYPAVLWASYALTGPSSGARRQAAAWLDGLPPYLLPLDILLQRLSGPAYRRDRKDTKVGNKDSRKWTYVEPLNVELTCHLLSCALNLMEHGGQALLEQIISVNAMEQGVVPAGEVKSANSVTDCATFLDRLLLAILSLSETHQPASNLNSTADMDIQYIALRILDRLSLSGHLDDRSRDAVEQMIIDELFLGIKSPQIDRQPLLMQILRSSLLSRIRPPARDRAPAKLPISGAYLRSASEASATSLLECLLNGLRLGDERSLQWTAFTLDVIPYLSSGPMTSIGAVCDCLCDMVEVALKDMARHATRGDFQPSGSYVSQHIETLQALVRVTDAGHRTPANATSKLTQDGSGFLGYVSTVFAAEHSHSAGNADPEERLAGQIHKRSFRCVAMTWITAYTESHPASPLFDGEDREKVLKVAREMYALDSADCLTAICFEPLGDRMAEHSSAFLNAITSPPVVAEIVRRAIATYTSSGEIKGPRDAQLSTCRNLLCLMEGYVAQLEDAIAVQIWGPASNMIRDTLQSTAMGVKQQLSFELFRMFTPLCVKMTNTHAIKDKRLKRELQDTFTKVLETSLFAIGALARPGDVVYSSPQPNGPKRNSQDATGQTFSYVEAVEYLGTSVVPNIKAILQEDDKISQACQLIANVAIAPGFRKKQSTSSISSVDSCTLTLLQAISEVPGAMRVWRGFAAEILTDINVTQAPISHAGQWLRLVSRLLDKERDRFAEILQRAAAPVSSNVLFSNKEAELLARALNIRKVSLALLAGKTDGYVVQLPTIQEKLVDLLRSCTTPASGQVYAELLLCLRVILCRFSEAQLRNLWPVILGELLNVFEASINGLMENPPPPLSTLLAGCKLLDLVLVLQTEEFQIHQWMFVTDTTDASCPPEAWIPDALLDRLATLIIDRSQGHNRPANARHLSEDSLTTKRRPLLTKTRKVEDIEDMAPFIAHASVIAYEATYRRMEIDWRYIEAGLESEVFGTIG